MTPHGIAAEIVHFWPPCRRCGQERFGLNVAFADACAWGHLCSSCGSELCRRCCDRAREEEQITTAKPPPLASWSDDTKSAGGSDEPGGERIHLALPEWRVACGLSVADGPLSVTTMRELATCVACKRAEKGGGR